MFNLFPIALNICPMFPPNILPIPRAFLLIVLAIEEATILGSDKFDLVLMSLPDIVLTSNMKKSSEKSFKHTNLKAIAKSSKQRMKSTHKQIIMPPSKHQLFKKL